MFCDGEEVCSKLLGCGSRGRPRCDDGLHCTEDRCDPDLDACIHQPVHSVCDNGEFCDGVEACDPNLGCMSPGSPCSGGEVCAETFDVCGTCGCWARFDLPGDPQTLEEVWHSQAPASCDVTDRCLNSSSGSLAACSESPGSLFGTLVNRGNPVVDGSCRILGSSSPPLVIVDDLVESELCLAEHQAFTLYLEDSAEECGLPDPGE